MSFPVLIVEFSPTTGPFDTPTWIRLSASGPHGNRVRSAEWTDGKQADLSDYPPGEAAIVLGNHDRLFDPEHASGTYFGDLLPRVPFRIRASHADPSLDGFEDVFGDGYGGGGAGTTTYDLHYGFVEDGWAQTYRPPKDALCEVKLVDMLGVLAGHTLPSVYAGEVLADNPVAFWPLDETDGAVMGDRSPNHYDGVYDNVELGGDPLVLEGKALTVEHIGDNRGSYRGAVLPTGPPVTLEAWVRIPRNLAQIHTIIAAQRDSAFGSGLWLLVGDSSDCPDGELMIDFFGLGGFYKARGHTRIDDGQTHHVVMTMASSSAADIKLYVDGVEQTKTVLAGSAGGTWDGHYWWTVGNTVPGREFDFGLGGDIDEVAIYDTALSATRVAAHYDAATALQGLRSDEQIEWALEQVGVPSSMFALDVGRSLMGPAVTAGRNALEFIRQVTVTEQGAFYVDHADGGKLRFRERYTSYLATRSINAQGTFSDDPAASFDDVVRVEPDRLQVEPNGITTIINQATVTWRGGTETVDHSIGSPYGPRSVSIDTLAPTPAVARGIGEWLIALNDDPQARIRSLGIDPGAAQSAFPTALGLQLRDRVAFRLHPQAAGAATTKQLEVLGRRHAVEGRSWVTDFYLTAAPAAQVAQLFTLGISELGGTDILAY